MGNNSKEFVCTEVRFKFWNGKIGYTVEYTPGLRTWFIFAEETKTNCLAEYKLGKNENAVCNHGKASQYLEKYFESAKIEGFVVNY